MRERLLAILLLLVAALPACAVDTPKDLPTIEALINLHKVLKGAEVDALEKVTTSYGEQSVVTKGARKYNDVRTTLNGRLSNGYSYVLLASAIIGTGTDLYKLIDSYSRFTSSTTRTMFHKPMVAWYYTEAMYACSREVKNIKKMYLRLTAAGVNVMKATMDEKMDMVFELRSYIQDMQQIIDDAYAWCSIVVTGGFHYDHIWDILNSEVTDAIAKDVIGQWFAGFPSSSDDAGYGYSGEMGQAGMGDYGQYEQ